MARIFTIKFLVDEQDEEVANDRLNDLLLAAKTDSEDDDFRVLDFHIAGSTDINTSMEDSIVNETYAPGDFVLDWVIYSRSEFEANDGFGYWSNDYGWTSFDLATRFGGQSIEQMPDGRGKDATWQLAL